MKIIYKILSILIVPAILLLYSYAGGSPGGKTGSPGDNGNTCTDCHSGTAQTKTGWITTNIPADGYVAGETYVVTATGTHPGVVKFGFELTDENSAGDKLGGLTVTDVSRTKYINSNNAITHTSAGNVPTGNTNSWSMDWTAPTDGDGEVTFYAAFNAANGNGNTSGDQIYKTSLTVAEYVAEPAVTSIDPEHGEQGWTGMVTVTGENTDWTKGVFSVRFVNHNNPSIKFNATGVSVKSDTELTGNIAISEDMELGTYDVFVDGDMLSEGFTVDIASSIGEDLFGQNIRVYPNPAVHFVYLQLPEGASYRLIDMNGRLLMEQEAGNSLQKLDVSNFEKGIYFIQIMTEKNAITRRFVKN